MKTYYLETLSEGCPKNILESSTYRKVMEENGYSSIPEATNADVVILNTCGCLQTLQDKAKKAINSAVATRSVSEKKIIAAGCYPLIDKDNSLKKQNVDFFPPGEVSELKKILGMNSENSISSPEASSLYSDDFRKQPSFVTSPSKYFRSLQRLEKFLGIRFQKLHNFLKSIMLSHEFHYVTLGKGCMGNCTFCGIKLAIGNPVSRSLNEIINNVRKGIVNGKKDIWLVSDDVGCWGQDMDSNSAVLLKEVLSIPSPMNLVINYFEPEMFLRYYEELKPSLADKRIIQICIPLQTGSQKLLKKMGRHYDIKLVIEKIKEVKKNNPTLVVKSQYITSFPGETWLDFLKSLYSMRVFDGIGVNAYARLKFTAAYNLKPNPVWVTSVRKKLNTAMVTVSHVLFTIRTLTNGTRA